MPDLIFHSRSPAATFGLGKKLGKLLEASDILALMGELGCGKTLFTRGICTGLEVPTRYVNSPTFAFVNEYRGRLPVYHMDLYRLNDLADGFGIGILDYLAKADPCVVIVEWAEKILSLLPESCLQVKFDVLSLRERQIVISGLDNKFDALLRELDKR